MLKRLLAAIPLASLLTACGNPVQEATDAIAATMGPKGTTNVTDTQVYTSGVVCGTYEGFDRWGESSGKRRFVYYKEELMLRPTREDFSIYCTETPRQVVEKKFGIPLNGDSAVHTAHVANDMGSLADALDRYYEDNGGYPSTGHGLAALVSKPERSLLLRNYPDGGYLDEVPQDPWQRPYIYEGPVWAGAKGSYSLWSYGADGKPGGSGPDADIGTENLKYLVFAGGL